jgi:hypothetical protein
MNVHRHRPIEIFSHDILPPELLSIRVCIGLTSLSSALNSTTFDGLFDCDSIIYHPSDGIPKQESPEAWRVE